MNNKWQLQFISRMQEDLSRIIFDEEIKQVIVSNKAIAAIDVSEKYGCMVGVWKILDSRECIETYSRIWPRNWNKNSALGAKAVVVLNLVAGVVHNMRRFNEGKITTCVNFRKVWELLTTKVLKAS